MTAREHSRMSRSDLARLAKAPENSWQTDRLDRLQDVIADMDDATFAQMLDAGRRLAEGRRT